MRSLTCVLWVLAAVAEGAQLELSATLPFSSTDGSVYKDGLQRSVAVAAMEAAAAFNARDASFVPAFAELGDCTHTLNVSARDSRVAPRHRLFSSSLRVEKKDLFVTTRRYDDAGSFPGILQVYPAAGYFNAYLMGQTLTTTAVGATYAQRCRTRVIQRRFNVGVLEVIPKTKASTL